VKWTARVDGPGPQPGVPQWDEDSLVIGGTHYVQAEWSTITIYSDATPTEPPPREKTDESEPGTPCATGMTPSRSRPRLALSNASRRIQRPA